MKVTYWILAVVLALTFGFAGVSKLTSQLAMVDMFTRFGYALWFMYFIGAAELAGALGLVFGTILNAKLLRLAALGLSVIMVGAIVSHLIYDSLVVAAPATVLLVLLVCFLYMDKRVRSVLQSG